MCNDFFQNNECKEFCDKRKTLVVKDSGNKQEYRVINANGKDTGDLIKYKSKVLEENI
ncbi:MAG: hypothetical protein RLZZ507_63 [Cyanobacteriota bacterium]|jgi:hypothetical protein